MCAFYIAHHISKLYLTITWVISLVLALDSSQTRVLVSEIKCLLSSSDSVTQIASVLKESHTSRPHKEVSITRSSKQMFF